MVSVCGSTNACRNKEGHMHVGVTRALRSGMRIMEWLQPDCRIIHPPSHTAVLQTTVMLPSCTSCTHIHPHSPCAAPLPRALPRPACAPVRWQFRARCCTAWHLQTLLMLPGLWRGGAHRRRASGLQSWPRWWMPGCPSMGHESLPSWCGQQHGLGCGRGAPGCFDSVLHATPSLVVATAVAAAAVHQSWRNTLHHC